MSMTTCSSLLLSKGSILTLTSRSATRLMEPAAGATTPEKQPSAPGLDQQRTEQTFVERMRRVSDCGLGVVLGRALSHLLGVLAKQLVGQPGRDDEGDDQREEHGRRGVDRNGAHVRAHQPGHEGQRQQRGDDREGGQNGRVAHLIGGVDGGLPRVGPAQGVVAVDVLDHHDGVVDQDADGEDQGEQRDPIQGVAEQVGGRQGQGQGRGHRDQHDDRFAPSQGQGHQDDHGEGGDPQMLHQLGGLLVGGEAVVPGLGDLARWRESPGPASCRRFSRSVTSSTALVPGFLATATVTAGRRGPSAGASRHRRRPPSSRRSRRARRARR